MQPRPIGETSRPLLPSLRVVMFVPPRSGYRTLYNPAFAFRGGRLPLSQGDRLGPYEIVTPLGAGGMGEVYKAKDSRLDRFVAIKVLPEQLAKDPTLLAR